MTSLATALGPLALRTPLVAMSGTVGSVVEWIASTDPNAYGAAIAKSVSLDPWPGRPAPRVAPTEAGMLNSIGIQNPGVERWSEAIGPQLSGMSLPVIGSAVGNTVGEYAEVAKRLTGAGVVGVEINLSCPNLDEGRMFALDDTASADVVAAVRSATHLPVGAKLSPNSEDIVNVAEAVVEAGADWLTLTNTVWGAAIDIETRRPKVSGVVGGYSGVAVKPIALRCVIEVRRALPHVPILGAGGVRRAEDVVEYVMAGASAVGLGTAHFESPAIARRLVKRLRRWLERHDVANLSDLIGIAV